jgi:parallel beta-helix repeat protein
MRRFCVVLGAIHDIRIQGNLIEDCGYGIGLKNVSGENLIRGNCVSNASLQKSAVGYQVALVPRGVPGFHQEPGGELWSVRCRIDGRGERSEMTRQTAQVVA